MATQLPDSVCNGHLRLHRGIESSGVHRHIHIVHAYFLVQLEPLVYGIDQRTLKNLHTDGHILLSGIFRTFPHAADDHIPGFLPGHDVVQSWVIESLCDQRAYRIRAQISRRVDGLFHSVQACRAVKMPGSHKGGVRANGSQMDTGLFQSLPGFFQSLLILLRWNLLNLREYNIHTFITMFFHLMYQIIQRDFSPAVHRTPTDLQATPRHVRPYFH